MVIWAPSSSKFVAWRNSTDGRPYSRDKQAPWASSPPVSSTSPLILENTGAQPGSVLLVMRMSPFCTRPMSTRLGTMRAMPVVRPTAVPSPRNPAPATGSPASASLRALTASTVLPTK